jgi:hypothetical protein
MTRKQMFGKEKATRTRMTDLPQIAVELSDREMRIVSGGLKAGAMACFQFVAPPSGSLRGTTQYNTGGDWDTDHDPF